jgi:pimeloyl-ACP methyl ester carboxylesterase
MGADERLFEPQRRAGLEFEVPPLIVPRSGETLSDYAARMRDAIDLAGPCVIGGVSFGGMLACEMARVCTARCVILIASCRNRASLPSHYRAVELLSRIIPDPIIQRRAAVSGRLFATLECITDAQRDLVVQMSRDVAVPQLRGIARMIVQWQAPACLPCPVHHIHGDADRIISIRRVQPEEIVPGGGHLINLTHADQVNRFIARHLNPSHAGPEVRTSATQ